MRVDTVLTRSKDIRTLVDVALRFGDEAPPVNLSFRSEDFSSLRPFASETAIDLLVLAGVVYAVDRAVSRDSVPDRWTRRFRLTIPVGDPELWNGAKHIVGESLSFLTSDIWEFEFTQRKLKLLRKGQFFYGVPALRGQAVSLFSGGLDSLVGIIDWLETHPSESLLLVGHHDPRISGPFSDQRAVLERLQEYYPDRLAPILVAAGIDSSGELTLRSRSFLFIALGMFAASALVDNAILLIPENGTIALNVPLTPSRSGACSTRTAHPYFLSLLRNMFRRLGLNNPIDNPLDTKTKGEVLAECLNQEALRTAISATASCAKRGHTSTWIRRSARQCGRCMPCIYRRASLYRIGLDNEIYGRDILTGEVDLESDYEYADDFRAYIAFLRRRVSSTAVVELLLASGKIDVEKLPEYAEIVTRGTQEVRTLLEEKAIPQVRHLI